MNGIEQSPVTRDNRGKFIGNLVISIILLSWVIMAIVLGVYDVSSLLIFGFSITVAPGVFIAGMIVSIVLKPKKSVLWILTFLI